MSLCRRRKGEGGERQRRYFAGKNVPRTSSTLILFIKGEHNEKVWRTFHNVSDKKLTTNGKVNETRRVPPGVTKSNFKPAPWTLNVTIFNSKQKRMIIIYYT